MQGGGGQKPPAGIWGQSEEMRAPGRRGGGYIVVCSVLMAREAKGECMDRKAALHVHRVIPLRRRHGRKLSPKQMTPRGGVGTCSPRASSIPALAAVGWAGKWYRIQSRVMGPPGRAALLGRALGWGRREEGGRPSRGVGRQMSAPPKKQGK